MVIEKINEFEVKVTFKLATYKDKTDGEVGSDVLAGLDIKGLLEYGTVSNLHASIIKIT